jgi:hypothetical protein
MLVHKAAADLRHVNLDDPLEVRYWCARLKVGEEVLRACVLAVGPHLDDVARRLKEAARVAFDKTGED